MEDEVSELTARDEAALAGLARWQATQAKWRRHDWCDANPALVDALMSGEMVAVPVEPTQAMLEASRVALWGCQPDERMAVELARNGDQQRLKAKVRYRAMLAAATPARREG